MATPSPVMSAQRHGANGFIFPQLILLPFVGGREQNVTAATQPAAGQFLCPRVSQAATAAFPAKGLLARKEQSLRLETPAGLPGLFSILQALRLGTLLQRELEPKLFPGPTIGSLA